MTYFWQNPATLLISNAHEWTDREAAELSNLFHLARTALAGTGRDSRYERRLWASREFHKLHPEISETAAYKKLDRDDAWRYSNPSDLTVANLILQQLGGAGRLKAMIGAHSFVGDQDSLTFKFKAKARNDANTLQVTLDPSDTYTMKFFSIRGTKVRVVRELDDVYAEDLQRLFTEETGLYLSL